MPLTDGTAMKASYDILEPLLNHRNKGTSVEEMKDWEKNYTYTNKNLNLTNVHYPKGSVARIVDKMRDLQKLKVRCIEFRACNLGTNKDGMSILGQCFGARFIVAPDQRMFFVHVTPGIVNNQKTFAANLKRLPDARVFQNPANSSDKLAIFVKRGPGTSRQVSIATTASDLHWFTDSYLWKDNKYVSSGKQPKMFYMEGVDLPGTQRYALPQEQTYRDHMIEVGPLPGNLI